MTARNGQVCPEHLKVENWLHGVDLVEFAQRYHSEGVISIHLNPENLASDLYREHGTVMRFLIWLITYPAINGAYYELFVGLSPQANMADKGAWGELQPFKICYS